jgi:hypothetical protein
MTMDDEEVSPDEIEFIHRFTEVRLHEHERPFTDVVHDYRRIEEEFVTRAGNNNEVALNFKRRISTLILGAAHMADQPHEVCRGIWEEVVERGFQDHETKRNHIGIYARCCQFNGEFAAGIAVLESLITEMEQALKGKALTRKERKWYTKDLVTLGKRRDELKAGIRK